MIRDKVFEALNNALENQGRDDPFFQQSNELIADDMKMCTDEFDNNDINELTIHIQQWKVYNGLASD